IQGYSLNQANAFALRPKGALGCWPQGRMPAGREVCHGERSNAQQQGEEETQGRSQQKAQGRSRAGSVAVRADRRSQAGREPQEVKKEAPCGASPGSAARRAWLRAEPWRRRTVAAPNAAPPALAAPGLT